ncbi:AEX-3 domain-containing protein [Gamsiella multidivaricata]|uniref:AEX-3 domain-containing protein n=1 Tax=Gamsiella multidivaricata TaxID=101098 RepID=UPI002220904B|nr:AEX-3 domain-containing protein [Gamsiella multidivaricata]KAI7820549.1 AEX-3 domain-containing protein [Gamsiella multidivaricata]
MTGQAPSPKRIADYFFMVGLRDDFTLTETPTEDQHRCEQENAHAHRMNNNPPILFSNDSTYNHTIVHSSLFNGDTTNKNTVLPPSTAIEAGAFTIAGQTTAARSPNRTRSKSMAQPAYSLTTATAQMPPTLPSHGEGWQTQQILSPGTEPFVPQRAPVARRTSILSTRSNNPGKRSGTVSDISRKGSTGLHHKPTYRHVSAGTLFKTVQEGVEHPQLTIDSQAGPVSASQRHGTYPTTPTSATTLHQDKAALSEQDMKTSALSKNMAMMRSRSRTFHGTQHFQTDIHKDAAQKPLDTHPAERLFQPIVTCRYPEKDWNDAEVFPPHLPMFCFPGELSFKLQEDRPPTTYHSFVMTQESGNRSYAMCVTLYERLPKRMQWQFDALCQNWTRSHMSESEMEYAKVIKAKISREKALLRGLQDRLREERTLGRNDSIMELKRDVVDVEEKLSLLEDQMQPWRRLFIEAEDVWVPRCVGLISPIPYHYLLRDWLLAVVVACSGGVEYPGMSLNSLRLERYVRNIIHDVTVPPLGRTEIAISVNNRLIYASRPALNSVPIVKNFSLFPLFRCLSSENVVTLMEVMLSEGRIILVSSYPGMLTLASESILYLFFPLYWQGVYIPILPAALMTCLQAPVPYIIGVERSCCDPDFPPEDACVVDLDKGTINVQLAPVPLPPRPRRKLIQSLEQYSSACTADGASSGPPKYVQEAYPHSRLTLFCGVSRAPRWNRKLDSLRPPVASTLSVATSASSVPNTSPAVSRKSSTNTLGHRGLNPNVLPIIPKVDFEKETLLEGFGEMKAEESVPGDPERPMRETVSKKDLRSVADTMDLRINQIAPEQEVTESLNMATRKILSPQRARANLFEVPKKQEAGGNQQTPRQQLLQPVDAASNRGRSNSYSTLLTLSDGINERLAHRASVTSLESSGSSIFQRSAPIGGTHGATGRGSPMSTMTSNTMASINGPSFAFSHQQYPSSSTTSLPPLVPTDSTNNSQNQGGIGFIEDEIESEPSPSIPITKEGHVLSMVPNPIPMSVLNCRCGICSRALAAHHQVYRCDGCSLFVHAGCIEELLYPCVPRGFDESGICWSVLQMWAGLLKGYRSGILAGQALQQQQFQQQIQMQMQTQGHGLRGYGHSRQLSSSGSESEKESKDRFSWASFRGWTSRSSANTSSPAQAPRSSTVLSSAAVQSQPPHTQTQQPQTRARRGTNSSVVSDTVRFHRDVFLKSVDKDARPFMNSFTESQAFVQFVQDRVDRSPGDPEIMFFDEVIKAKINRSRFRLGKEETKFLDDASYGIQSTVKAVAPSGEIQEYDDDSRRFPTHLNPAYL